MSIKDIQIDFEKIIDIFNNEGKSSASNFVKETYGVPYATIQRRIVKESKYRFNRNIRKYEKVVDLNNNFLSIDELFSEKSDQNIVKEDILFNYECNLKNLVTELIKDKLLEINKYIKFEQNSKSAIINIGKLQTDGYRIKIIED